MDEGRTRNLVEIVAEIQKNVAGRILIRILEEAEERTRSYQQLISRSLGKDQKMYPQEEWRICEKYTAGRNGILQFADWMVKEVVGSIG